MSRKICVVSGTRAEYGLLRQVMREIHGESGLELQLIATGTHLSEAHGFTCREIEDDGFTIDHRVEILQDSDTPLAVTRSTGLGIIGCGEALQQLAPDLLLVLGDRYEILSAAVAAMILGIPVAHLHGGEVTEGAFDDSIRHALSKFSHLHFVATDEYRRRVIQLGEDPERVYTVGGLGIDSINSLSLLDRPALEKSLGFEFGEKNLLITHHPETLDDKPSARQMSELLAALDTLEDTRLIFTLPNADPDNRAIADMIHDFVANHTRAAAFASLGQVRYFSCIQFVDAVVGNSSSGLTEVPSFSRPTINIGDRQKGRIRAASVIDCDADRDSILAALQKTCSPEFQKLLESVVNPYGEGGASKKIVEVLKTRDLRSLLKKSFYDLDFELPQH